MQGIVEFGSLVLKAGPSLFETDTMLIDADGVEGSSTRHDRQSAALFLAADIHSNVIVYVVSSSPHLFTLLLEFFHSEILQVASGHS